MSTLFSTLHITRKRKHLIVRSNPLICDPLFTGDNRTRSVLHHAQRIAGRKIQILPDQQSAGVSGHNNAGVWKYCGASLKQIIAFSMTIQTKIRGYQLRVHLSRESRKFLYNHLILKRLKPFSLYKIILKH